MNCQERREQPPVPQRKWSAQGSAKTSASSCSLLLQIRTVKRQSFIYNSYTIFTPYCTPRPRFLFYTKDHQPADFCKAYAFTYYFLIYFHFLSAFGTNRYYGQYLYSTYFSNVEENGRHKNIQKFRFDNIKNMDIKK